MGDCGAPLRPEKSNIKRDIPLNVPFESVDKVDTLLAEMPFAENQMIFGLHSTAANTTHALKENRFVSGFR